MRKRQRKKNGKINRFVTVWQDKGLSLYLLDIYRGQVVDRLQLSTPHDISTIYYTGTGH